LNKHKFTITDRQALYEVYDKKCFYCTESLLFSEMEIDHIVPENLVDGAEEWIQFLKDYQLPANFAVNSISNWVPAHARCNNRKSGTPFPIETTLYYLGLAERKVPTVEKKKAALIERYKKDFLLTTLSFRYKIQTPARN
jgi:hypothetical protein